MKAQHDYVTSFRKEEVASINPAFNRNKGHAKALLVETLCCQPEGRGFDSH
jgi:hypothetical protein